MELFVNFNMCTRKNKKYLKQMGFNRRRQNPDADMRLRKAPVVSNIKLLHERRNGRTKKNYGKGKLDAHVHW